MGLSFSKDNDDVHLVRQMIILEAFILSLGSFILLHVVCHEMTLRFANGRVHKSCESYEAIVPLHDFILELHYEIGILRFLKRFDLYSALGVLLITRSYEVAFHAEGCRG